MNFLKVVSRLASFFEHYPENDDLGRAFYKSLTESFYCKLIDFDNFSNNELTVVTELPYNNEGESFRPDITILINGIPLSFIEVKIPNNNEGVLAERNRINARFSNKKNKKFMNITQFMIFSNNNEYDEDPIIPPIQGAFYASSDLTNVKFNFFREENIEIFNKINEIGKDIEKFILKDNNLVSILGTNEFETNKNNKTPTNKILTSLYSLDRISFFLKYGIAYVNTIDDNVTSIEKHVMRYPQFFATLAIRNTIENKIKKGIIWHTQGSGKTALAYFNVNFLKDYFQKKNIITKFYFVTDRLDLATQAKEEFENRDLKVEVVSSKEDFVKNIKSQGSGTSPTGKLNINVVNIHKFSDESVSKKGDYDINIQRIYFLDEVHRSYNPKGSFLANLIKSDRDAIIIGLTGTPLISKEFKSKDIFGDYIHKYYYNKSIKDCYTLRLIREEIETTFRDEIKELLKELEIEKGKIKKRDIFSHKRFVKPLTEYILKDYKKSKIINNDDTIGGMIVCDSSDQAKEIFNQIKDKVKSALILHDVDDKETRKENQLAFKKGEIDILIVFNMLLTGFDAKRLKKLYLGRVVKEHNLLQTLTRVNRPYKKFKYWYVVDFANIEEEFEKTNQRYFEELKNELGNEFDKYSSIFKPQEDIKLEIELIKEKLFYIEYENLEEFQKIISNISNKKELFEIRNNIETLKEIYNCIELQGFDELKNKFSFDKLSKLLALVSSRIKMLNLKDNIDSIFKNDQLLNEALEDVDFNFKKISEEEMLIADQFRDQLSITNREMDRNYDKKSPEYIALLEELKRIFKKKGLEEFSSSELKKVNNKLEDIYEKVHDINNKNKILSNKYENDYKFARLHKKIINNKNNLIKSDVVLHKFLLNLKHNTDNKIINNHEILNNEDYFSGEIKRDVMLSLKEEGIKNLPFAKYINEMIVEEYTTERVA